MDKNIIAALIIGATILLHPLVEDSTKDYKWSLMRAEEQGFAPVRMVHEEWFYEEEECEKAITRRVQELVERDSCIRFLR